MRLKKTRRHKIIKKIILERIVIKDGESNITNNYYRELKTDNKSNVTTTIASILAIIISLASLFTSILGNNENKKQRDLLYMPEIILAETIRVNVAIDGYDATSSSENNIVINSNIVYLPFKNIAEGYARKVLFDFSFEHLEQTISEINKAAANYEYNAIKTEEGILIRKVFYFEEQANIYVDFISWTVLNFGVEASYIGTEACDIRIPPIYLAILKDYFLYNYKVKELVLDVFNFDINIYFEDKAGKSYSQYLKMNFHIDYILENDDSKNSFVAYSISLS